MRRRFIAACLAASLWSVLSTGANAHSHDVTAAELDAMHPEQLEGVLARLERELALVHRDLFTLAMRTGDLRAAGLALRAWRGHLAMAQALVPDAARDARLSARVALHAHALAIEGRAPRGLERDVRALSRELVQLSRELG
jgi:hypothetical protein